MEPYSDTPDEGGLVVSVNYTPIVWKDMPSNTDIEISRVLDRSIRESKMLDLKEFCISPGNQSFQIFIDCYVLSYDGNLLDALNLAAVKALMNTNMPIVKEGKITTSICFFYFINIIIYFSVFQQLSRTYPFPL